MRLLILNMGFSHSPLLPEHAMPLWKLVQTRLSNAHPVLGDVVSVCTCDMCTTWDKHMHVNYHAQEDWVHLGEYVKAEVCARVRAGGTEILRIIRAVTMGPRLCFPTPASYSLY
jgi:hypothetical protein